MKIVLMLVGALALAVSLAACGNSSCDATNCLGCCDATGVCQAGTAATACGLQGAACVQCPGGQTCTATGACSPALGTIGGNGGSTTTTSTNGTNTSGSSGGTATNGGSTGVTSGSSTAGTNAGTNSGTTTGTNSGTTTGTSSGTTTGTSSGSLAGPRAFAPSSVLGLYQGDGGISIFEVAYLDVPLTCSQLQSGGPPSTYKVAAAYVESASGGFVNPGSYDSSMSSYFGGAVIQQTVNGSMTYSDSSSSWSMSITQLSTASASGSFNAQFPDAGSLSGTFSNIPMCPF